MAKSDDRRNGSVAGGGYYAKTQGSIHLLLHITIGVASIHRTTSKDISSTDSGR
jgi:hypothetical protein